MKETNSIYLWNYEGKSAFAKIRIPGVYRSRVVIKICAIQTLGHKMSRFGYCKLNAELKLCNLET